MKLILGLIIFLIAGRLLISHFEQKSIYFPIKAWKETPDKIKVDYEDCYIKAMDGTKLNAWYIPHPKAKTTVLFCHGNAGNISHRLFRIQFFQALEANVLMLDYRGYGKSSGRPSEKGLYQDVLAAYDYLVIERNIAGESIIAYGKSLGCAVVTELSQHREIGYLVLESPFVSVEQVAQEMITWFPMKYIIRQRYDNASKLASSGVRKLIVHGRYDEIIDFKHAETLHQLAAEPKSFIAFDGGHNDTLYVTSEAYQKVIKNIMKTCQTAQKKTKKTK
jgi:uncharacterized protein